MSKRKAEAEAEPNRLESDVELKFSKSYPATVTVFFVRLLQKEEFSEDVG